MRKEVGVSVGLVRDLKLHFRMPEKINEGDYWISNVGTSHAEVLAEEKML